MTTDERLAEALELLRTLRDSDDANGTANLGAYYAEVSDVLHKNDMLDSAIADG